MSLWNDAKEATLEECVTTCQNSENISKQIVECLSDAKCNEDTSKINWCIEYLSKIRNLARLKINQITLNILENVEKFLFRSEEEKKAMLNKSKISY